MVKIAKKAKECGIELFVLDDGWFGNRRSDRAGLGDWIVNKKLLPNGIEGLAERIEELGMQFGLWIEPEMINKDSNLYRQHPDWILQTPGMGSSVCIRSNLLLQWKTWLWNEIFLLRILSGASADPVSDRI